MLWWSQPRSRHVCTQEGEEGGAGQEGRGGKGGGVEAAEDEIILHSRCRCAARQPLSNTGKPVDATSVMGVEAIFGALVASTITHEDLKASLPDSEKGYKREFFFLQP